MRAIYRRELGAYFHSPIGYVYVAVQLLFTGYYFMGYNMSYGYPYFSYTLMSMSVVLLFTVPVLTMRSMADERRSRTDQLLLTAPVSLTGLVLGKYLAMVTVVGIPVGLSIFCPLIIALNGTAHLASDYVALLAFFLLACTFVAVGQFISSLTESQVVAAVGTFAALMALYLWSDLVSFLPTAAQGLLGEFSILAVMEDLALYQVLDLAGIVLYISLSVLFLFFTVQTLQKRRWS